MRKSIFPFLLCFGSAAAAQTWANRDPVYQMDYEMLLAKPGSSIMIATYKSPSEQEKSLVLLTSSPDCSNLKGVRMRLSNGENIIEDQIPVTCSAWAPDRPNVKASLLMTPELEAKLDGQEIVEFALGYLKTPVKFKETNENLQLLLRWVKDERGF